MRGVGGYGRYDDDPNHVGCPYAKSDMTPCIARDGRTALANEGSGSRVQVCVGCVNKPGDLLRDLVLESGHAVGDRRDAYGQADALRDLVREVTEPAS